MLSSNSLGWYDYTMLNIEAVTDVVGKATRAAFQAAEPISVRAVPDIDHYGSDALRVTLAYDKPSLDLLLAGDGGIDVLARIQKELQLAGEERFAFVRFLTKRDLELDGEPEP